MVTHVKKIFKKQHMKKFEVDQDFILDAYNAACADWKEKLKTKFPDAWPKSIIDKIKTFDDIEAVVGKVVLPYANPITKQQVSTNAFVKIQYISRVLNEGWVPDFNNDNEQKWYPWFQKSTSGWGLCTVYLCYDSACLGSDFFYKSEELARYAATQFLDIYKEYLPE